MSHAVTLLSGGMDSATLAYDLADQGFELTCLAVNYGQRHRKELRSAARIAEHLKAEFVVVDLTSWGAWLTGSALTDNRVAVPHGHYAAATMKATVVPNRNATMLSLAVGLAISRGSERVGTAVHSGDHAIYPDCRPEFIASFNRMIALANEGLLPEGWIGVDAPYVDIPKDAIARLGEALGVPWADTWSCYEGGDLHCGKCGTCTERIEAFALAKVNDPTRYQIR